MTEGTSLARQFQCAFETPFPPGSPFLDGSIRVMKSEVGVEPGAIIFNPEKLLICVEWEIHGSLAHLICGKWCVCVDFDCVGEGPDFDYDRCRTVEFDCTSDGKFRECFEVTVKDLPKTNRCTTVCRIIATVSLLDCRGRPSRIAGFCDAGIVQFSPAE